MHTSPTEAKCNEIFWPGLTKSPSYRHADLLTSKVVPKVVHCSQEGTQIIFSKIYNLVNQEQLYIFKAKNIDRICQ